MVSHEPAADLSLATIDDMVAELRRREIYFALVVDQYTRTGEPDGEDGAKHGYIKDDQTKKPEPYRIYGGKIMRPARGSGGSDLSNLLIEAALAFDDRAGEEEHPIVLAHLFFWGVRTCLRKLDNTKTPEIFRRVEKAGRRVGSAIDAVDSLRGFPLKECAGEGE
jgi:hypothetical protein